jgi:hypothetical protein
MITMSDWWRTDQDDSKSGGTPIAAAAGFQVLEQAALLADDGNRFNALKISHCLVL